MHAIVTGGAGFIGSHLVDLLVSNKFKVTVIDDLRSGSKANLTEAIKTGKVEFIDCDINEKNKILPLFENCDYIFHLAGMADIVPSIEDPEVYHHSNVNGTLSILECARKSKNLKKLVYAASSSCYGMCDMIPTPETANITPMYPYALTKFVGEQYLMHWGKTYKIPVISLRLFNVYGPRARSTSTYGAVFKVFLAQKYNKKPLTVVGDGNQSRDFVYVSDVVEAFLTAAESKYCNEVFNIGSGNHYSINKLVELLGCKKTHLPERPGEPRHTFADISKITKAMNWAPKVTFERGVLQLLKHDPETWANSKVWHKKLIENATESWFKFLS